MRRDRIGPPCRGSGRRTSPSCAPVYPFCHPLRARGPGRGLPTATRCYGVARQRDRSRQNSRGPRACFLSGISGSRVGAEESGAASIDLLVSAARCGATGSGRHAADRAGEPLHRAPPFTPSVTLYAREGQAVVCPLLRAATGSLANAIGRAKTAEGLGRAFSPAFRARAWVPKNLARRVLIYWFRRRDAARPDRAAMPRIGPANLSIVRPRLPLLSPSTRARARPWSAHCYALLRGRSPTRSVAPKQPRASGVLSLRHFGLARGCRRIWRGEY